jgi:hypothetical protein
MIKHKKQKKQKKPKETGPDIVIDTQMPASLVSIANPYSFMMPTYENQITIAAPQLAASQIAAPSMPAYQPFY